MDADTVPVCKRAVPAIPNPVNVSCFFKGGSEEPHRKVHADFLPTSLQPQMLVMHGRSVLNIDFP